MSLQPPAHHDLRRLRREYASRAERLADSDIYALSNPAYLFTIQQRQRETLKLLQAEAILPLANKRVLELGCGSGGVLQEYLLYGAAPTMLHGTDLLPDRLGAARTRLPHLPLTCADGQSLPYPSGTFDLALQYTVFSSILDDAVKQNLAAELLRVVRPGGLILWYDFWLNPTNPHTRGIRPPEIRGLFPGCRFVFKRVTLAPPITRWLVRVSWLLCALLEKIRIFNSHYLVAIRACE